jgi:hypothetical protein
MKKLMAVLMCVGLFCVAHARAADPAVYLKLGTFDFTYPLAHVDASPYLHDFVTDENLMGADMWLVSYPNAPTTIHLSDSVRFLPNINLPVNSIHLNLGAASSFKSMNVPYASLSVNLLQIVTNAPTFLSYIAIGFDHDFRGDSGPFLHPLLGTAVPFY